MDKRVIQISADDASFFKKNEDLLSLSERVSQSAMNIFLNYTSRKSHNDQLNKQAVLASIIIANSISEKQNLPTPNHLLIRQTFKQTENQD